MEAVAGASISLHANEAHANEAHANEEKTQASIRPINQIELNLNTIQLFLVLAVAIWI